MDFPGGLLYFWSMKYVCLILCTCLFACFPPGEQNETGHADARINKLLSLYQPAGSDTLAVESGNVAADGSWKYRGTLIDTALLQLLPAQFHDQLPQFYACYRLNLDANTIGLITRTPSEYGSTSIKLFAYHKQTRNITFETELAEAFSEEGSAVTKSSWLYHPADSGWLGILENFASSANDEDAVASNYEAYDYYHLRWNGHKMDTTSTDSSALVEIFKQLSPEEKK